jgi:hypothetical protein
MASGDRRSSSIGKSFTLGARAHGTDGSDLPGAFALRLSRSERQAEWSSQYRAFLPADFTLPCF